MEGLVGQLANSRKASLGAVSSSPSS
jgi:hypothetical protein